MVHGLGVLVVPVPGSVSTWAVADSRGAAPGKPLNNCGGWDMLEQSLPNLQAEGPPPTPSAHKETEAQ